MTFSVFGPGTILFMPVVAVPPDSPASVVFNRSTHVIEIRYNGAEIFQGRYTPNANIQVHTDNVDGKITQTIAFEGSSASVDGTLHLSDQSFASETQGPQQIRFPIVRNSDGPSFNLRNNAVYDRAQDIVLEGPADGHTRITPGEHGRFRFHADGPNLTLIFKPRFYQKHKNIAFFEPWKRDVRRDSIAGWCSWWPYRDGIDEKTVFAAADVFNRNLKPFGYDTIQVDDGYQEGAGAPPDFWLKTNSRFPSGVAGLAKGIKDRGMRPGIWIGTHVKDDAVAKAHPDWFVRNPDGTAHKGPWISYAVDGSNKAALDALFRPVFSEFRQDGFDYVKVDSIRHLLYDALYPCREQMLKEGVTPEQAFRDYLGAAHQEIGEKTYLLACWGVLPEAVGIADACRLGGDGFGPSTMLQYNSWNNVVWRNDPDAVDISPPGEDVIRPTLVCMAGAQMLLSDRTEFYEDSSHINGARRASPVPFTRPGQLYDFDPTKTDNLIKGLRNQNGGTNAGPIDADQQGPDCPFWQLDVSRPFEQWTVLARFDWNPLPDKPVSFSDLGLPKGMYAVYEFWSHRYLGDFAKGFVAPAQLAKETRVYGIRRIVDHPQVVSTSRHITQGGPDLLNVTWDAKTSTLRGQSLVVAHDPYEVTIRLGDRAVASSSHPMTGNSPRTTVLSLTPEKSGQIDWWVKFKP